MELFDRANAQIRWLNGKITPAARWTAVMLAVAAAVAFGYLGARRGERQYVDLMRGVPVAAAQLPAMEAALAKANLTDHEIREGSIHVPRGRETAYMAALAEAEGMSMLMAVWIKYMTCSEPVRPTDSRPPAMAKSILSMILPCSRISTIPAANPTISAAPRMSLAPSVNCCAMVFAL